MRNIVRLLAVSFVFVLFTTVAFSQLSEGGTPAGFKLAPTNHLMVEQMPVFDIDSMYAEDAVNAQHKEHPFRFGYNHLVNYNIQNSGRIVTQSNGDRIWQLDVRSSGAISINLAFSSFYLPDGAKLFVYSPDHTQILGAFTSANNYQDHYFGTDFIYDDEVIVEYDEPANVSGQGTFTLFRVTHGYKNVFNMMKALGDAGNCINNVNCPQYSAWGNQKRSAVCLVSGGSEFCSGSLVNNTSNDGTPYILTANHCGTADGTWVFRFNWEGPGCPNPASNPASQSISGGTPVANRAGSDFDLCRMSSVPPSNFNVFYAGWDHSGTPATSVTCIHHPSGDIKKLSQANNAVTASTYSNAQTWRIGQWTDGVTEGGSSGSPLFDQNKRIIGQLYGGSSACGASAANLNDDYGRFDISWNTGTTPATRLRDWLDPGNTGAITNDGYDPNVAAFSLDAAASSVVSPAGSSCNTTFAPVITIRNSGATTITAIDILYHLDSNTDSVYHWSGSLTSTNSTNVTLSTLSAAAGTHTFRFKVVGPNAGTDLNPANDSTFGTFIILNPVAVALPFNEGFTTSTFPPTGWTLVNTNNNNTWTRSTTVGGFGTTTNSVKEDETVPFFSTSGQADDLITPYINMTTGTLPAFVKFDVAYAKYNNTNFDSLVVFVSADCGLTWTRVYTKGGSGLATAPNTTNTFVPTAVQWRRDSVNVSSYLGQSAVRFKFEHISGWGNVTYLDNINISAATAQAVDAGINNLSTPADHVCTGSLTPTFTLLNQGQDTLKTLTVYYQLDNGSVQSYSWTGSLASTQNTVVTLAALTPPIGNHTLRIFTSLPNSVADGNNLNDTLVKNFTEGVNPVVNLGADTTQCGGSVTLNAANAGASYLWSNNTTAQYLSVSQTGNYSVTVTSNNCSASSSILVTLHLLPIVSLGADGNVCGSSHVLNAGNAGDNYLWNDSSTTQTLTATTSGVYAVTVSSGADCSASDSIQINLVANPTVSLLLPVDTICTSAGAITLSGGNPAGGAFSGFAVNAGVFNTAVATSGTYPITYTYTDANNCKNSAANNLIVEVCADLQELSYQSVRIQPNPSNGSFEIYLDRNTANAADAKVYDAEGKLIYSVVLVTERTLVSLPSISTGSYLLQVNTSTGTIRKKLLVEN